MRLLLACPACTRQYDASGNARGTRFHCSCGATVEVTEPRGQDAAVVRCSSCGAPRSNASSCTFCGSDFTLHERDLNMICPDCLSRISDKAKYCHHCGLVIAPQQVGSAETLDDCPACGAGARLSSRQLGSLRLSVLECGRCAGLWISIEALRNLEKRAKAKASDLAGRVAPRTGEATIQKPTRFHYRPCVVCGQLMHRRNYGRRSGVLIDSCADHGVWFDNEELSQVLSWIRQGGPEQAAALQAQSARQTPTSRYSASRSATPRDSMPSSGGSSLPQYEFPQHQDHPVGDLLAGLGSFLIRTLLK